MLPAVSHFKLCWLIIAVIACSSSCVHAADSDNVVDEDPELLLFYRANSAFAASNLKEAFPTRYFLSTEKVEAIWEKQCQLMEEERKQLLAKLSDYPDQYTTLREYVARDRLLWEDMCSRIQKISITHNKVGRYKDNITQTLSQYTATESALEKKLKKVLEYNLWGKKHQPSIDEAKSKSTDLALNILGYMDDHSGVIDLPISAGEILQLKDFFQYMGTITIPRLRASLGEYMLSRKNIQQRHNAFAAELNGLDYSGHIHMMSNFITGDIIKDLTLKNPFIDRWKSWQDITQATYNEYTKYADQYFKESTLIREGQYTAAADSIFKYTPDTKFKGNVLKLVAESEEELEELIKDYRTLIDEYRESGLSVPAEINALNTAIIGAERAIEKLKYLPD